jgi:hypothetical protein
MVLVRGARHVASRAKGAAKQLGLLEESTVKDEGSVFHTQEEKISSLGLHMRDGKDQLPMTFGEVEFSTRQPDQPLGKFACVSDASDAEAVVNLLEAWIPKRPNVIISVTGSAQRMELHSELESLFLSGLAAAARSTNAWIFDGGTDSGVMRMVGEAFEDAQGEVPLIGVMPWRMVTSRELFFDPATERARKNDRDRKSAKRDQERSERYLNQGYDSEEDDEPLDPPGAAGAPVRYVKRVANSSRSSAIDMNHSHFLFVDDGKEKWGGEINLRAAVEKAVQRRMTVPGVLLVVQARR